MKDSDFDKGAQAAMRFSIRKFLSHLPNTVAEPMENKLLDIMLDEFYHELNDRDDNV